MRAFKWAIACFRAVIAGAGPADYLRKQEWLARFEELLRKPVADSAFLYAMSEQIWYSRPDRTPVLTGVSRLFAALADERQAPGSAKGQLRAAISNLSMAPTFDESLFAVILELYEVWLNSPSPPEEKRGP